MWKRTDLKTSVVTYVDTVKMRYDANIPAVLIPDAELPAKIMCYDAEFTRVNPPIEVALT